MSHFLGHVQKTFAEHFRRTPCGAGEIEIGYGTYDEF